MSGIATAVVASAVIGSIASKKAGDKAIKASGKAGDKAAQITRDAANEARAESKTLFAGAQQNAGLGFQGALDVFGQSLPQQVNAFQQGNVGAQQQILAGLPQIQNAILGGNVDLSALQPTNIQTDLGFFNQQLPEFTNPLEQQQQPESFAFAGPSNPLVGISNPLAGVTVGGNTSGRFTGNFGR